jgi:hypothetical protein
MHISFISTIFHGEIPKVLGEKMFTASRHFLVNDHRPGTPAFSLTRFAAAVAQANSAFLGSCVRLKLEP